MKRGSIRVRVPAAQLQTKLQKKLSDVVGNRKARLETNKIYLEMSNKYVPYEEGTLRNKGHYTEKSVIWDTEYAHYQYVGIVYGPNFPIYDRNADNGKPVSYHIDPVTNRRWPVFNPAVATPIGFRTPKGMTKYPTNRSLSYHKDGNPLASKEWDKKMLQNDRRAFNNRVTSALKKIAGGKK